MSGLGHGQNSWMPFSSLRAPGSWSISGLSSFYQMPLLGTYGITLWELRGAYGMQPLTAPLWTTAWVRERGPPVELHQWFMSLITVDKHPHSLQPCWATRNFPASAMPLLLLAGAPIAALSRMQDSDLVIRLRCADTQWSITLLTPHRALFLV